MITRIVMAALLAGTSGGALAQQQAAADTNDGIPEIVVTAERRSQSLQRVPISISAITSEQLDVRQITEARDLSAIAPNIAVNGGTTNAAAAVVTIRGIPTNADESMGFDSPIGMYLDGVYLGRSSASTFEVADIERVEVLRGPQGTLFGRNTTGGAVNFITKAPAEEFGFALRGGLGNYDQRMVRASINSGRIGDALRLSASYLHRRRDGVVDNILQPDSSQDPGGFKTDTARVAAVWDVTDNLKVSNTFDWTRTKGVPMANQLTGVGDGVFRPNAVIDGVQVPRVQPANVAGYLAAATALQPQCGAPLASVTTRRLSSMCLDQARPSTDTILGNLTRVEYSGEAVTIRSSTSWRKWRNVIEGSDLDGLGTIRGPAFTQATTLNGLPQSTLALFQPAGTAAFLASQAVPTTTQPLFQASNDRRQTQFSQELELISAGDGPFQWVLGAFYYSERGYERNPQDFAFVLDTNQAVFSSTNFGALAPLLQAGNPARFRAVVQSSTLGYRAGGRSVAVYGQASYRPESLDSKLGVTLGMRYTWDRKWVDRFQNGATPFAGADVALNQRNVSFSAPTGHLTVDYRATDDVNFYARVAKGYRSGGFNLRQSTSVANNIGLIPFEEEKIWSYELGTKLELFDRLRINAAVFRNNYSNLQATVPIPITGGGSFGTQVVNAGKIEYTGFEIEGQLRISSMFSIDGGVGHVVPRVKNFPGTSSTGAIVNIASVATPGNAPAWTGNLSGNVRVPLKDDVRMVGRVGWSYVSSQEYFGNPLNTPFADQIRGNARSLLDAQLRFEGLKVGPVKNAALTFWGKNLTNQAYVNRGIDFGQLGFGSVIFGDPRTYGMTLDIAF